MSEPLLFAIAVLTILSVPGPTNTLLFTSGATVGVRRSLRLTLAEMVGYNIDILTIGLIAQPFIAAMPKARIALSAACGIYLFYLAFRLWKVNLAVVEVPISMRNVFITTLLNPKGMIFALVVVPMHASAAPFFLAAFSVMAMSIGTAWITFGAFAGRMVKGRGVKLIPRAAAILLAGFAIFLIESQVFR